MCCIVVAVEMLKCTPSANGCFFSNYELYSTLCSNQTGETVDIVMCLDIDQSLDVFGNSVGLQKGKISILGVHMF